MAIVGLRGERNKTGDITNHCSRSISTPNSEPLFANIVELCQARFGPAWCARATGPTAAAAPADFYPKAMTPKKLAPNMHLTFGRKLWPNRKQVVDVTQHS